MINLRIPPLAAPDACPERRMGMIIQRNGDGTWVEMRPGTLAEVRKLNEENPVFPDEDPLYGWVPA